MSIPWAIHFFLPFKLVSIALCSPLSHSSLLLNRQSSDGVVSGLGSRDANDNVFVRRDIRDLRENFPDQWNLYILGLDSLQRADQNDPYSFYGLASVHGRPYKTWGDAPGLAHKIGTTGYCPHSNRLFLTWHRPYLALYEQVLYEHIQTIASNAPDEQFERYSDAAYSFRMPYWDWALGEKGGPVPEYFTTPTITITNTDGLDEEIDNPLYNYRFHDLIPGDFDGKWSDINATVRWPTSDDFNAESQQELFIEAFNGQQNNIITEMGVVFRSSSFARFADRLEQPHGWIHGVIGGGWEDGGFQGHFWPLQYSAFDPLFMLHHTNVDRLFVLYQAANPDLSMEPFNIGQNGNVFLENGQTVDENTELLPFRKESGEFWTTRDCWDHTVLGYTYPETQRWIYETDEEYRAAVDGVISNLYSGAPRRRLSVLQTRADSHTLLTKDGLFTDWTIETQAFRRDLPSTFILRFSLTGDFSSDPPIDVGRWMILMPTDHESNAAKPPKIEQLSERASTLVESLKGTIDLTPHLLDQIHAGVLDSLDATDVEPYLRDKLTWKLYSGDGQVLSKTFLNALTIEVYSTIAHIPDDMNKPIHYSDNATAHPIVTIGKNGGVKV